MTNEPEPQYTPSDRERFDAAVAEERRRQVALGYDTAHDDEHDIIHLFDVARHKAYQGHSVEVAAMLDAIYAKLARQSDAHDARVRREAAAEQAEKDAVIAVALADEYATNGAYEQEEGAYRAAEAIRRVSVLSEGEQ